MEVLSITVKDKPISCSNCRFKLSLEDDKCQCLLKHFGMINVKYSQDELYKSCIIKEYKETVS